MTDLALQSAGLCDWLHQELFELASRVSQLASEAKCISEAK